MFKLFTTKITASDIGRAITFADAFIVTHSEMIPPYVREAWGTLRAALLRWKKEQTAQEVDRR